jgi:hypothetical protein
VDILTKPSLPAGVERLRGNDYTWPLVNAQYNLDDWGWFQSGDGLLYQTQVNTPTSIIGGLSQASHSYINVITARTSALAGNYYVLMQLIEGWEARHLVNGCAFSGWFLSTLAGTYGLGFRNRGGAISYIHPVTLTANSWTPVNFTIPAMTSITGNMRENLGMYFSICLAAGSTYHTTADNWNAGNFFCTSAQTNFPATLGAQFYMHALNLVPGSVPQPYAPLPYPQALARVMRHRQVYGGLGANQPVGVGQAQSATAALVNIPLPVPLLGVPSFTLSAAGDWRLLSAIGLQVLCTSIALPVAAGQDPRVQEMNAVVSTGLVAGDATRLQAVNTNARMIFEAYPT